VTRTSLVLAVSLLLFSRVLSAGEAMEKLRDAFRAGRQEEALALVPEALREATRADSAEIAFYDASSERVAELADMKLMEVARNFPESPFAQKALLRSAIYQFENDNLAKSEYLLRKILTEHLPSPFEPEVRLWLGKNYVMRGEHRSAKVELTHGLECLEGYPKTPSYVEGELSYWLGEACEANNELQAAYQAYLQVTLLEQEDPLLVLAMRKLALLSDKLGKPLDAELWREKYESRAGESLGENIASGERRPLPAGDGETREEKPAAPRADEEAFWVQMGSFSSNSNAEELKDLLVEKGFAASVSRIKVEGKNYFRVRLGPYSDRDAALEALDRVKHLGIDGRVLKGE
jgi:hypothetical protein